MDITCFYHNDCVDGFAAMWAVKKKYPEANCYPVDYGKEPPHYPTGLLIIADFTFDDKETMVKLIDTATYTLHLDHHKGARELTEDLQKQYKGKGRYKCVFDERRSGAGITWDKLFKEGRPHFINLVEDRDIWKFRYEETEAFGLGIREQGFNLEAYDKASTQEGLDQFIDNGRKLVAKKQAKVKSQIEDTNKFVVVELPEDVWEAGELTIPFSRVEDRHEASEQTHMAMEMTGFSIVGCWWPHEGRYRFRLSSSNPDGPDVTFIAKHFGGGGHTHASGFHLDEDHPIMQELLS